MTAPPYREYSSLAGVRTALLAAVILTMPTAKATGQIKLTDVTRKTGIRFAHTDGGSGRK